VASLPPADPANDKVLVIGPRTIQELFLVQCHGYRPQNVLGIDLYSRHPRILVDNMEDMKFKDDRFDFVMACKTITYADDLATAISEVARVLKPGGRFVFNHTFSPGSDHMPGNKIPSSVVMGFLRDANFEVYHHTVSDTVNKGGNQQSQHLYAARLVDLSNPSFDRAGLPESVSA
jgi:SAM-dependent methyltransferase